MQFKVKASADEESARGFPETSARIITGEGKYCQFFMLRTLGCLCEKMASRTYIAKEGGEKIHGR